MKKVKEKHNISFFDSSYGRTIKFSGKWHFVIQELELTITAATTERKFRSRLQEKTVMSFKAYSFSPGSH